MIRKYILPLIAIAGVLFAVYMVRAGGKPPKVAEPVAEPAKPTFDSYVAGSGLVEAATENIAIGTPVAGVVSAVYRQVPDAVRAGLSHEVVRRLAPVTTSGSPEESFDEMIVTPTSLLPAMTRPATAPTDIALPAGLPKINVNSASADELAALPGVGQAGAARVIAGRPYASIWDLEGTPLFKIDDRAARAELAVKKASADQFRRKLAKMLKGNREEEVRVAAAQNDEAIANYENMKRLYERWARVEDQSAVPPDELSTRKSNMVEADARVRRTRANLEMLQVGAWEPDLDIARSELASAEAMVRSAQTEIDRLTVRAQVDGQVLQVRVRPGEYAPSGVMQTPLMLIGRTDVLHIRVDVDEHEAMRVRETARAVASIRGDSLHQVQLKCIRIEPYVIPKKSLTGDSSERVDTRVLQIVYAFNPKELHAYVGQQMDVFIETGR